MNTATPFFRANVSTHHRASNIVQSRWAPYHAAALAADLAYDAAAEAGWNDRRLVEAYRLALRYASKVFDAIDRAPVPHTIV